MLLGEKKNVLVVVDMQRYYLEPQSDFYRYNEHFLPGSMQYISERCTRTVIPNIQKMQQLFRERGWPVVFLKLCAKDPERKDMHPFFYRLYQVGKKKGWDNIYPLKNDPMCQVVEPVKPEKGEMIFIKTTFSAFTSTPFHAWLVGKGIDRLLFTGLATSQCVETTARDASDRGFEVVLVEDAQADYEETVHNASLYSSQGVCGGIIRTAEQILRNPQID